MAYNNTSNVTVDELADKEEPFSTSDRTGAFVLYGLLSFFIVLANSLILLLIWRKRRLRTTSNTILASLATNDLLTGLLAVPMVIVCSATLQREVCIAMDISNRFLAFSSVGHLILLSIDRYIRVTKLLQYPIIVTPERLGWALGLVWVFALGASMIQLSWILTTLDEEALIRIELGYDFFHMAGLVVVPLFLMGVVYTRIFISLRRHSNRIHSDLSGGSASRVNAGRRKVNEKKIALLFIAMITVFICGLFFYFLWALMEDMEVAGLYSISPKAMNMIVTSIIFFRFLTALCNPLLCTFMKQDFLNALKTFSTGLRDRSSTM